MLDRRRPQTGYIYLTRIGEESVYLDGRACAKAAPSSLGIAAGRAGALVIGPDAAWKRRRLKSADPVSCRMRMRGHQANQDCSMSVAGDAAVYFLRHRCEARGWLTNDSVSCPRFCRSTSSTDEGSRRARHDERRDRVRASLSLSGLRTKTAYKRERRPSQIGAKLLILNWWS